MILRDTGNAIELATYDIFSVGSAFDNYLLKVGTYEGTAGDALTPSNNTFWSSIDQDNDLEPT